MTSGTSMLFCVKHVFTAASSFTMHESCFTRKREIKTFMMDIFFPEYKVFDIHVIKFKMLFFSIGKLIIKLLGDFRICYISTMARRLVSISICVDNNCKTTLFASVLQKHFYMSHCQSSVYMSPCVNHYEYITTVVENGKG